MLDLIKLGEEIDEGDLDRMQKAVEAVTITLCIVSTKNMSQQVINEEAISTLCRFVHQIVAKNILVVYDEVGRDKKSKQSKAKDEESEEEPEEQEKGVIIITLYFLFFLFSLCLSPRLSLSISLFSSSFFLKKAPTVFCFGFVFFCQMMGRRTSSRNTGNRWKST